MESVIRKLYHTVLSGSSDICGRIFLIYLFLRFSGVSYGRFIAVRFGFNLLAPELFFKF